jgi:2-oxoglutarate dehydrogenase E1 component
MTVANLTTPAQIYHILRRQVKREFRKPLVIMTPKSLLRHPKAVSSLEELSQGTFQEVIFDSSIKDPKKVETVVFSSGKVYYDLLEEREKTPKGQERTALVRLEQIYPFPDQQIKEVLKTFSKAKNIVWCQEEPKNMGYFQNVYFKFTEVMETEGIKGTLKYVGRAEKASPATGSIYRHKAEQAAIVAEALKI